jgi:hypothetical protein
VWQDMPSFMQAGKHHGVRGGGPDIEPDAEVRETYRRELTRMLDTLQNFACIVVWVPFNEGWGQHDTVATLKFVKGYDPTRLVNGPSGWEDRGWGDLKDMHRYPGPGMFPAMPDRATVLGEFGGLGLPVQGHLWQTDRNWGYQSFGDREGLLTRYEALMNAMLPLIGKGLSAAVYTQTTDCEGEVNGLMTYDRKVLKFDAARLAALHAELYKPPVALRTLVPDSREAGQVWRYTWATPAEGWEKPGFDDGSWKEGPGQFGSTGTPDTVIRTEWRTPDIWIRRTFTLDKLPEVVALEISHDEDAEIYLNGEKVAEPKGYGSATVRLSPVQCTLLKTGANTLAAHCHQTQGGQAIDVGLSGAP